MLNWSLKTFGLKKLVKKIFCIQDSFGSKIFLDQIIFGQIFLCTKWFWVKKVKSPKFFFGPTNIGSRKFNVFKSEEKKLVPKKFNSNNLGYIKNGSK